MNKFQKRLHFAKLEREIATDCNDQRVNERKSTESWCTDCVLNCISNPE